MEGWGEGMRREEGTTARREREGKWESRQGGEEGGGTEAVEREGV